MTRRDYPFTLRHMLDHAQEAVSITRGRSREILEEDRLLNLALTRLVEIVGEAAGRIPREERRKHARDRLAPDNRHEKPADSPIRQAGP